MRATGVAALALGVAIGLWVVRGMNRFEMDFRVLADGSVDQISAERQLDDDTRYAPDVLDVLKDLRPGDKGYWLSAVHPRLPLKYDVYRVERGGESFEVALGRTRYRLILGGLSGAPVLLWLMAQGVVSAMAARRRRATQT